MNTIATDSTKPRACRNAGTRAAVSSTQDPPDRRASRCPRAARGSASTRAERCRRVAESLQMGAIDGTRSALRVQAARRNAVPGSPRSDREVRVLVDPSHIAWEASARSVHGGMIGGCPSASPASASMRSTGCWSGMSMSTMWKQSSPAARRSRSTRTAAAWCWAVPVSVRCTWLSWRWSRACSVLW